MKKRNSRAKLRRTLQQYADVVICPRLERYKSAAHLNAERLAAAQQVIRLAPGIALDICQMANSAPRGLPFAFTELDAWRIAVDAQQMLAKAEK